MARRPSLPASRCFEAAPRLQHYSLTAQELSLTHGAISRAVRLLEEVLQTPLFERRNRQVFLTPAGEQLYTTVHTSLVRIQHTSDALRQPSSQEQRALVLSCEPTLADALANPTLASLFSTLPGTHHSLGGWWRTD